MDPARCVRGVVGVCQVTSHPVTLYGFLTGLVALIGVIMLVALGDVSADVGLPIIAGLGAGGVGAAAGVATPNRQVTVTSDTTGDVGIAEPEPV